MEDPLDCGRPRDEHVAEHNMARARACEQRLRRLEVELALLEHAEWVGDDERRAGLLRGQAEAHVRANMILGHPRELCCEQRGRVRV